MRLSNIEHDFHACCQLLRPCQLCHIIEILSPVLRKKQKIEAGTQFHRVHRGPDNESRKCPDACSRSSNNLETFDEDLVFLALLSESTEDQIATSLSNESYVECNCYGSLTMFIKLLDRDIRSFAERKISERRFSPKRKRAELS
jgi:hypothetical protein